MECFGYLCGLNIGNRNGTNASPVNTVRTDLRLKYSASLRSYKSACKEDSNLKSFDYQLKQRLTSFMMSLDAQTKSQSLSLDSLMEVYEFVLELNQDAVRKFIESREDVWKNKDLRSLVEVYFKSTAKTLDFFNTVDNCVKRADNMQLLIRFAVQQFEKESICTELEGNEKKKYSKTLWELNKFKAVGDPFGDEFVTQFKSVYDQQVLLLEEFHKLQVKLEKKQRNVKSWRTLSNVVFVTAFASILVLSVVLVAVSAVPVVAAVASALTVPIERVGKWFSETLKAYENAVGSQKDLVILMENRTRINNEATTTIRIQVDDLRIRILSILENVEFAVERKEDVIATKLAMQEIMKKVEGLTNKIEEVGDKASKCSKFIASGRFRVLEHIDKLPSK